MAERELRLSRAARVYKPATEPLTYPGVRFGSLGDIGRAQGWVRFYPNNGPDWLG